MIRHGSSRNQVAQDKRRPQHRRATSRAAATSRSSNTARPTAAQRITAIANRPTRSLHAHRTALHARNPAAPKPLYP